MRTGAGFLTLTLAVCLPGLNAPEKCLGMKSMVAAAHATGTAQADEADWSGPPGTLVHISAPEEPFLPVTFPPEQAPPAVSRAIAHPPPGHAGEGLSRAFFMAPALLPYFIRATAATAPRTPLDAERQLLAWGFTQITNMEIRGGSYVCEATGPRRERVRLVLDVRSGEISGMEVIGFENKRY